MKMEIWIEFRYTAVWHNMQISHEKQLHSTNLLTVVPQLCKVQTAKNYLQAFESCSQNVTWSRIVKASSSLIKCTVFPGVKHNVNRWSQSVNQWWIPKPRQFCWSSIGWNNIFLCSGEQYLIVLLNWIAIYSIITWNISKNWKDCPHQLLTR